MNNFEKIQSKYEKKLVTLIEKLGRDIEKTKRDCRIELRKEAKKIK